MVKISQVSVLKWSWYMNDDDVDGKSGMGNPRVLCANYLLNE